MSDTKLFPPLPDRFSNDPKSPHHVAEILEYNVGVILSGAVRTDVEEYCISEGWVKVISAEELDSDDEPLLVTIEGVVETFYNTYAHVTPDINKTKSLPTLPNRLSRNPNSPHYVAEIFEHNVGVILSGTIRNDVEEYCISEGWVKVNSAEELDSNDQPLMVTLEGVVETFYNTYPAD